LLKVQKAREVSVLPRDKFTLKKKGTSTTASAVTAKGTSPKVVKNGVLMTLKFIREQREVLAAGFLLFAMGNRFPWQVRMDGPGTGVHFPCPIACSMARTCFSAIFIYGCPSGKVFFQTANAF